MSIGKNCEFAKSMNSGFFPSFYNCFVPNGCMKDSFWSFVSFVLQYKIVTFTIPIWVVPAIVLFTIWYIIFLADDLFDYIGFKIIDLIILSEGKLIEIENTKKM